MNSALVYYPPSKWPLINAFATAIAIHLCAVALAERRAPTGFEPTVCPGPIAVAFEDPDPTPSVPEFEVPSPPPPVFTADFIENARPSPLKAKRDVQPVRSSATMTRSINVSNARAFVLSGPRPEYPYAARRQNITGSGVATLHLDEASGSVLEVRMERSIGNSILDQSALSTFRRWRFKPGTPSRVRVPITFTMAGAQF